ncbi:MAG: hypothetical protein ACKO96_31575, partial [Flammeovirgaceae bacterium]
MFMGLNWMNVPILVSRNVLHFIVVCLLLPFCSFSQNLSQHNWYFGKSNNGIRFNRATNKPQLTSITKALDATGGTAVATDPTTANLLFYTDGQTIRDATHQTMENGDGLTGNTSSNQVAVICPVPGNANKYFVFTNTVTGDIHSTVVDMSAFGKAIFPGLPLGEVEKENKNKLVAGLSKRSEGMIIIPHANGTDFWLITHSNDLAVGGYSVSQISNASYQAKDAAVVTTTIYPTPSPIIVASFSYNKSLKKLAVATQSIGDNAQVLDFNPATGSLTLDRIIPNTASTSPLYDIEWGSSGKNAKDQIVYYLYISRLGNATDNAAILQYDYSASGGSPPVSIISQVLTNAIYESYGLQLAPDSTIYHLYRATNGGPYFIEQLNKIRSSISSSEAVSQFTLYNVST